MALSLPTNPSLDSFQRDARRLLRAVRDGTHDRHDEPLALASRPNPDLAETPNGARAMGGPNGWTALFHLAASRVPPRDALTTARTLLAAGSDPNAGYPWLGLPLRALAAAGGDLDELVEGRTLLHHAAWMGDVELVQALLDSGANPDAVDAEHGTTPLGWAEHGCAEETATVLRARRHI